MIRSVTVLQSLPSTYILVFSYEVTKVTAMKEACLQFQRFSPLSAWGMEVCAGTVAESYIQMNRQRVVRAWWAFKTSKPTPHQCTSSNQAIPI